MDMDWYNDFQNMVRSDDIARVIDRHRLRKGRDLESAASLRKKKDILGILDALYACDPESYPAAIRLANVFHAVTPDQMKLVIHTLRNGTFTDYAMEEGVTKAAVGQRWKTVVKRSPLLAKVKRGSHGKSRRVLEGGMERGADAP